MKRITSSLSISLVCISLLYGNGNGNSVGSKQVSLDLQQKTINQTINQAINQTIKQAINQTIKQAIKQNSQTNNQDTPAAKQNVDIGGVVATARAVATTPIPDSLVPAIAYDQAEGQVELAYQVAVEAYVNANQVGGTLAGLKDAIYLIDPCYNQAVDAVLAGKAASSTASAASTIAAQVTQAATLCDALGGSFSALPAIAGFEDYIVTAAASFGVSIDEDGQATVPTNIGTNPTKKAPPYVLGPYQTAVAAYINDLTDRGVAKNATLADFLAAAWTSDPLYNQAIAALKEGISKSNSAAAIADQVNKSEALLAALQPGDVALLLTAGLNAQGLKTMAPSADITPGADKILGEVVTAAAAFGITIDATTGAASPCVGFATVSGTQQALHFHQGDYHSASGFFVGMERLGVSNDAQNPQRTYALAQVNQNAYGGLNMVALAPDTIKLNTVDGKANPLFSGADQGVAQLMLTAGQPVAQLNNDPSSLYYLPATSVAQGGKQVLTNADAADPENNKYSLNDPTGNAITAAYDLAVTQRATQISSGTKRADNLKNVIFVAGSQVNDAATFGVNAVAIQSDHLEPLVASGTDATDQKNNVSAHISLLATDAIVADTADASLKSVASDAANLWWDDEYQLLFGTLKGIAPGDNAHAYGVWQGGVSGDTFKLSAMEKLAGAVEVTNSEQAIANSIFGAGLAGTNATCGNPLVNLTRPRTMHTSTNKDYLLVTGGVHTDNTIGAEQAWVNALPIMPAGGANPGKLAKNDFSGLLGDGGYDPALTPIVDRSSYAVTTLDDKQTPVVVGRYPGYLATVEPTVQSLSGTLYIPTTFYPGSTLMAEVTIASGSKIGANSYMIATSDSSVTTAVSFDPGTVFVDGTSLQGSVNDHFLFGPGTIFADKTQAKNDLAMNSGSLSGYFEPKAGTILAKDSVLAPNTQAAAPWLVDFPDTQKITQGTTLATGSVMTQGSVIQHDATNPNPDLQLGSGAQVTLSAGGTGTMPGGTQFSATLGGYIVGSTLSLVSEDDLGLFWNRYGRGAVFTDLQVTDGNLILAKGATIQQGAQLPRTALFYEDYKKTADYEALGIPGAPSDNHPFSWVLLNWQDATSGKTTTDASLINNMEVKIPAAGELASTSRVSVYMPNGTILPPFTLFKKPTKDYEVAGAPAASTSSSNRWDMLHAGTANAGLVAAASSTVSASLLVPGVNQSIKIVPDGEITFDGTNKVVLPVGGYVPRYTLFYEGATNVNYFTNILNAPASKSGISTNNQWILLNWKEPYNSSDKQIENATQGLAQQNIGSLDSGKINSDFTFDSVEKSIKIPLDGKLSSDGLYDLVIIQDTILPVGTRIFIPPGQSYIAYIKTYEPTSGMLGDIPELDNNTGGQRSVIITCAGPDEWKITTDFKLESGAYIQIPQKAINNFSPCMPAVQGSITLAGDSAFSGAKSSLPKHRLQTFGERIDVLPTYLKSGTTAGYNLNATYGLVEKSVPIVQGTLKKESLLASGTTLAALDAVSDYFLCDENWQLNKDSYVPRTTLFRSGGNYANINGAPTEFLGKDWALLKWENDQSGKVTSDFKLAAPSGFRVHSAGIIGSEVALQKGTILPQFTLFFEPNSTFLVDYSSLVKGGPNAQNITGGYEEWLLNWDGTAASATVSQDAVIPTNGGLRIASDGVVAVLGKPIILPAEMTFSAGTTFKVELPGDLNSLQKLFDTYQIAYDQTQLATISGTGSYTLNGYVKTVATNEQLPAGISIIFAPSLVENTRPRIGGTGVSVVSAAGATLNGDITIAGGSVDTMIAGGSLLTPDSTIEPCFTVGAGALTLGGGAIKLAGNQFTQQGGYLSSDGTKMVGNPLKLSDLTVAVDNLTVGAGSALVAGDTVLKQDWQAASASSCSAGTEVGNPMTLNGLLKLSVDAVLEAGSKLATGSQVTQNSLVGPSVVDSAMQVALLKPVSPGINLTINADASSITLKGSVADNNGSADLIAPRGTACFTLPAADWNVNKTVQLFDVGTPTKNPSSLVIRNSSTLEAPSIIGAGSLLVSPFSTYGFSTSDMQILGDSAYLALEGDRTTANGVEAGIFKSTAVFADDGKVRGWTPWRRIGGSTDAVAYFGLNPNTNNITYLTSPTGEGILDYTTGFNTPTVLNPATAAKLTTWSKGDNSLDVQVATATPGVYEPVSLHNGASLGKYLQDNFTQGVYGLFDFGPDTPGFMTYQPQYEDPQFSCMAAVGVEQVALVQTGVYSQDTQNFEPTKQFIDKQNSFFWSGKSWGLDGLGVISSAEFTRRQKQDNYFFVGGAGGLAVLYKSVHGSRVGTDLYLERLSATAFPGEDGYRFEQLHDAHGQPFSEVRRIVADQVTGYIYVVMKDRVCCFNPNATGFFGQTKLAEGYLDDIHNHYITVADAATEVYSKAFGSDDAYTDLMILQVADAAPYDTVLLLATTNGLYYSDPFDIDNLVASHTASLTWNPVKASATLTGLYQSADLNARRAQDDATNLGGTNWDDLADVITGVIGYVADYYAKASGFGYDTIALPVACEIARALGVPESIAGKVGATELSDVTADAVRKALDGTTIAPTFVGNALAITAADPAFAAADPITQLLMLASTLVADVQQYGDAASHTLAVVRALNVATIRTLVTNNAAATTEQQLELSGAFGAIVDWYDRVVPRELNTANVGLKTVLRLQPLSLQAGDQLIQAVAGQWSYEGNIHVYATDASDNELRLYRLNASKGAVGGIAEQENTDAQGNLLPYFARLGAVSPDACADLTTHFYGAAVSGYELDVQIATFGGLPSLLTPAAASNVLASQRVPRLLDAGQDYRSSLAIPELKAAWNSGSGAVYIPTDDGARVNE